MTRKLAKTRRGNTRTLAVSAALASLALSACSSTSSTGTSASAAAGSASSSAAATSGGGTSASSAASSSATAGADKINVTLVTKDPTNHFWTAMMDGAKKAADELGVNLTLASGRDQTDADSQIQAIENAISRGDAGILIANNGPAVNDEIKKARDAGLAVIALDTPTDPGDLVDATFASDNFEAGKLIGQWTAKALGGKPATIALLDLFADKVVTIDYQRDQGFLAGMGIDLKDEKKNGDEAKKGNYSGGTYEIVCNEATNGAEDGGRSAMENCISANPNINVVFTANETSGVGAVQALKAAGIKNALVTSIDGSCGGVKSVVEGSFGAVAQQYPSKMGDLGVRAIVDLKRNGTKPTTSAGLDFLNTGIKLVADKNTEGLDAISSADGTKICW
ncbi:MAG: sugar transporter substrate-binding protein [Frankiales bacterium]|nr:sugar transporter substrate-binding protein [Frankiales bacterium]